MRAGGDVDGPREGSGAAELTLGRNRFENCDKTNHILYVYLCTMHMYMYNILNAIHA